MTRIISFETLGKGVVTIDTGKCEECVSKICEKACQQRIYEIQRGIPTLSMSMEDIKRGGCIDCLACELDCEIHGRKGIEITYPMPELEEYLRSLKEKGMKPIWAVT